MKELNRKDEIGVLGKKMIEDTKKYPGTEFKLTHFLAMGEYKEK